MIRDRETVYRLLDGVAFSKVLDSSLGPIRCRDFNEWHTGQTEDLCERAKPALPPKWVEAQGPQFPVGWGAKMINVFLKTAVYAGGLGREGLRDVLHPPLDNGLRQERPAAAATTAEQHVARDAPRNRDSARPRPCRERQLGIPVKWRSESDDLDHRIRRCGALVGA